MAWHVVAGAADLEEGAVLGVRINGWRVALYRIEGAVYATADLCSHDDALLSDGFMDGDCIECPLHQALFHIPSGEVRSAPATEPIQIYAAKEEGGSISVELPG